MIALTVVAAAAAAVTPAPARDAQANDPPKTGTIAYRVRAGDYLVKLAHDYLRQPRDYVEVQRLNHVANPHHLPSGSTLLIPVRLLRTEPVQARVVAFRGTVTLNGARQARIGQILGEGARIATGVNSSVSFSLADDSKITLPSLSIIHIVRLRRTLLSGAVERVFLLETGRSEAEVTPSRGGRDPFEIRTPISVAAVRGTQFRVAVEPGGQAASTSVVEGEVNVAGMAGTADVPAEYGLKSDIHATGKPVPLLPPPDFDLPVHVKPDGKQVFTLISGPGAARYRLQIANDDAFQDVRSDVTQAEPTFELPPMPEGTYLVRATAIDGNDVEGLPTKAFRYTYRSQHRGDAAPPAETGHDGR